MNYIKKLFKKIINFYISYYFNKNFRLIFYFLGIRDLKDKYSATYLNLVLLELLQEFDIKYNITK
jgi:hypothetical protein